MEIERQRNVSGKAARRVVSQGEGIIYIWYLVFGMVLLQVGLSHIVNELYIASICITLINMS